MQGRKSTHGKTADVCFVDTAVVNNRQNVEARTILGIKGGIIRHIRRGITPGIKYNAMVSATEKSNLWLPTAIIPREFVDKNKSVAFP
jgi:hypothetical protein